MTVRRQSLEMVRGGIKIVYDVILQPAGLLYVPGHGDHDGRSHHEAGLLCPADSTRVTQNSWGIKVYQPHEASKIIGIYSNFDVADCTIVAVLCI